MNKNNDFEHQLSKIKLKQPSENYIHKGINLLNELEKPKFNFNWSYLLAFCLMLSLAFNWYQFKQPTTLINQGNLVADNTPSHKQTGGYKITQGAMVPYGGQRNITIIMEN